MSFVSNRHFSWISRVIKHHVINLTCELPITEAMANINMANITLSYLMNAQHRLRTRSYYILENRLSCVWMCVRNIHHNYMETSVIWVILPHHCAIWSHSLIAHLCATSILIPQTNHSHSLTALGSCWLILWGFCNSSLFL